MNVRRLTLMLVVCLVSAALAFGQRDALSEVRQLMAKLDYTDALRLLARTQREHPELRDETQPLIEQIISEQGEKYNQVLAQLIHVLYDEQDTDKALPLINILGRLDANRSAVDAARAIDYVKFLQLMNAAAERLAKGQAQEALDLYLLAINQKAGFDLEKPAFDASGFGDLVMASVRESVDGIKSSAMQAQSEQRAADNAQTALIALVVAPVDAQSVDRWNDAILPLQETAQEGKSVLAAVSTLDTLERTLGGKSPFGMAYIRYLKTLCLGRDGRPPEGIAVAIRMTWKPSAESVADAALANAVSSLSEGVKQFDAGDLPGADSGLLDAYYRSLLAVKAVSFAGGEITQAQEMAAEADSLRKLVSMERAVQSLSSDLAAARTQTQALHDQATSERKEWLAKTGPVANSMAARFDSFVDVLDRKDLEYATTLATGEETSFAKRLADIDALGLSGEEKMNDMNGEKEHGAFVPHYPRQALDIFNRASTDLNRLEADIASYRTKWTSDSSSSGPSIAVLVSGLDQIEARVKIEASELSSLSQSAEQQHEDALMKRKEADIAFAEAKREFSAKRYDNAKSQVGDAQTLYLDSLSYEEDKNVRQKTAEDIPDLLSRIYNASIDQDIAAIEVQTNEGRNLFSQGEFLRSFLVLESAQERWRATLGDRKNTELDTMVDKAKRALQLSGGRDLSSDDSRAPTVNGFLSLANAKLDRAVKMSKSDPERKQLLDDAYSNVTSALEIAPVYRVAKAIQLRIRKIEAKDDEVFRTEARGEIDSIIADYRSKKDLPEKLYFMLKDYEALLPDYQPLKDTVQEIEIALGFRIRPPSAEEIAKSTDFFEQAHSIYDPEIQLSYDVALSLLDKAIALNPFNAKAKDLRHDILLREGSPEASGMSTADLAKFLEAKRLYNTENFGGAWQILQEIYKGRNKDFPPLRQLYNLLKQIFGW